MGSKVGAEEQMMRKQTQLGREINNFAVRSQIQVKKEIGRQAQVRIDNQYKIETLSKERSYFDAQDVAFKEEVRVLETKSTALQAKVDTANRELQRVLAGRDKANSGRLNELRLNGQELVETADEALLRIPTEIKKGKEEGSKMELALTEKRQQLEAKHQIAIVELRQQNDAYIKTLAAKLEKREELECQRHKALQAQFAEIRAHEERIAAECQDELKSLLELAASYVRLVSECEDGKYPAVWRDGMKEVVLPAGARHNAPPRELYPHLFGALDAAEQKVSALELRAQRPLSAGRPQSAERLRHTVAAATGRYDNVSLVIEGISTMMSDQPSATSATAAVDSPRDLETCIATLCESEETGAVMRLLEGLSNDTLRKLCVELRVKALQAFAPAEEREALRREALSGLEDESTAQYVDELEQQRDEERAAFCEVVERGRELYKLLESRKTSLLAARLSTSVVSTSASTSRPTSRPPSRSSSRPRTPAHAGMGSNRASRPHSATTCATAHTAIAMNVPRAISTGH